MLSDLSSRGLPHVLPLLPSPASNLLHRRLPPPVLQPRLHHRASASLLINMLISVGLIESIPIIAAVIAIVLLYANPFLK